MQTTKTSLQFGDIVLVVFPITNESGSQKIPKLVLLEHQDDLLTAAISSRLDRQETNDIVLKSDKANKLVTTSLLKPSKLSTIHKNLIYKKLGTLNSKQKTAIKKHFVDLMKAL